MRDGIKESDSVRNRVRARIKVVGDERVGGDVLVRCMRLGPDGKRYEAWREEGANLVVNAGLTHRQSATLLGGTQITTWYIAPIQAASSPSSTLPTVAAADTMSSHAGWVEVEDYDEANRVQWVGAAGATGVVSNTASPAEFTIDTNSTHIGGVILTSNNTKGGTTGTLFAGKAFSAVRTLQDNDTLEVTYTNTNTAS